MNKLHENSLPDLKLTPGQIQFLNSKLEFISTRKNFTIPDKIELTILTDNAQRKAYQQIIDLSGSVFYDEAAESNLFRLKQNGAFISDLRNVTVDATQKSL
jgi:hypothetical protein